MGNAALLLRQAGHEVLGADKGVYPPMSTVLRDAGIEVLEATIRSVSRNSLPISL